MGKFYFMLQSVIILLIVLNIKKGFTSVVSNSEAAACNLPQSMIDEIKSYEEIANKIFQAFLNGSFKGKPYNDLETLVDTFGHRFSGTTSLENAISFMKTRMNSVGLENVHGEPVSIPQWVRGYEYAEMIYPRRKQLNILGLGWSSGTSLEGIEAEIVIVKDFQELYSRKNEIPGKIVIFNAIFVDYATTSQFRKLGAFKAFDLGAVAVLVRSVATVSLNSPHTGAAFDNTNPSGLTRIPAAAITLEDADLLQRLVNKDQKVKIRLIMNDYLLSPVNSANLVGEYPGTTNVDEIVIISAHIDTWDVGQGAMDDGGGVIITMNALELLKEMGLQPRRTLRMILWTGEEMGFIGAKAYLEKHKNELGNISVLMESDAATFRPLGLGFAGSEEAGCIIQEISKLLAPINASSYETFKKISSDVDVFVPHSVPGISLRTDLTRRYWIHHTEADTLSVENPEELDLCAAAWAATAYILADLSIPLPR